jgi:hypothetical protein
LWRVLTPRLIDHTVDGRVVFPLDAVYVDFTLDAPALIDGLGNVD